MTDASDPTWPVELYIYDLSHGLAAQLSGALLGRHIPGVWHTSVVVYGKEYFFGQGISVVSPGSSHHGRPMETVKMGDTSIDQDTWNELLSDLRERYTAEKYHLLNYNCNTFTNECCEILVGKPIPDHITSLPSDFLSTPLGAMLRPQIDAMFGPTSGVAPASASSVTGAGPASALLGNIANRAYAGNSDERTPLPAANGTASKLASSNKTAVSHPHNSLGELKSSKLSTWSEPLTFDQKLNYRTVLTRIDTALTNASPAATTSIAVKAELQDAGKTFRTIIIPALELATAGRDAPLDDSKLAQFEQALSSIVKHLGITTLFPFFELARDVALKTARGSAWCARAEPVLRPIMRKIAQDQPKDEKTQQPIGVKSLQSGYRMIANGLSARAKATASSSKGFQAAVPIEDLVPLFADGLLHPDQGVQESAASAAWNLILLDSTARGTSGSVINVETSTELLSALLEAIKKVESSTPLLELLARSVLKLLYKNRYWEEGLSELFELLEGPSTVDAKRALITKETPDLGTILDDLDRLVVKKE